MSHILQIFKIKTTFKDDQIILLWFFEISTGFRFTKKPSSLPVQIIQVVHALGLEIVTKSWIVTIGCVTIARTYCTSYIGSKIRTIAAQLTQPHWTQVGEGCIYHLLLPQDMGQWLRLKWTENNLHIKVVLLEEFQFYETSSVVFRFLTWKNDFCQALSLFFKIEIKRFLIASLRSYFKRSYIVVVTVLLTYEELHIILH